MCRQSIVEIIEMSPFYKNFSLILLLSIVLVNNNYASGCKVESERLKAYTKAKIERLLDVETLRSIYWPKEPLEARALSKATGLNVLIAETQFESENENEIKASLIQDMFVSCSTDRNGNYMLTMNLELDNPFRLIEASFLTNQTQADTSAPGEFKIRMPGSTILVQLNQLINYDECLEVQYVQLSPNFDYSIDCDHCNDDQKLQLDKTVAKRRSQLDGEIDALISGKLLLGIQTLLNQQRLDLDLYLK